MSTKMNVDLFRHNLVKYQQSMIYTALFVPRGNAGAYYRRGIWTKDSIMIMMSS